jgi:hypothetical protein
MLEGKAVQELVSSKSDEDAVGSLCLQLLDAPFPFLDLMIHGLSLMVELADLIVDVSKGLSSLSLRSKNVKWIREELDGNTEPKTHGHLLEIAQSCRLGHVMKLLLRLDSLCSSVLQLKLPVLRPLPVLGQVAHTLVEVVDAGVEVPLGVLHVGLDLGHRCLCLLEVGLDVLASFPERTDEERKQMELSQESSRRQQNARFTL